MKPAPCDVCRRTLPVATHCLGQPLCGECADWAWGVLSPLLTGGPYLRVSYRCVVQP